MGFLDGGGISWTMTDNHINTSSLNFYRPDALSDTKPAMSKHWRQKWNIYGCWCSVCIDVKGATSKAIDSCWNHVKDDQDGSAFACVSLCQTAAAALHWCGISFSSYLLLLTSLPTVLVGKVMQLVVSVYFHSNFWTNWPLILICLQCFDAVGWAAGRACVRACVRARARVCVYVCVRACVHACVLACVCDTIDLEFLGMYASWPQVAGYWKSWW